MLRNVLGPQRDEVIGGLMRLHIEELNGVIPVKYCWSDEIKEYELGSVCGEYEGIYIPLFSG
jgi:hypothetical protein